MRRSRRVGLERVLYAAAYRCEGCRFRVRVSVLDRLRAARFASCPKCSGQDLTILKKRDRVDRWNRNPLRIAQRFLGASLYHCWSCRLQFYDLRYRSPRAREKDTT